MELLSKSLLHVLDLSGDIEHLVFHSLPLSFIEREGPRLLVPCLINCDDIIVLLKRALHALFRVDRPQLIERCHLLEVWQAFYVLQVLLFEELLAGGAVLRSLKPSEGSVQL